MHEGAPLPIGPEEEKERVRISTLLDRYMAGDSHEHTIFSNPLTRHEADYDFKQIVDYVQREVNRGKHQTEFIVFTEHSSDTGNAKLIDGIDLLKHKQEIEDYKSQLESEGLKFPKIYSGVEANIISPEGDLDVPNDILAEMDLVIASKHDMRPVFPESNGQPNAEELTNLYLNLMDNPEVDVIGHPTRDVHWQIIEQMDWEALFAKSIETNTAIEINIGVPLPRKIIKMAARAGAPLFIGTDAHILEQFQFLTKQEKATIENSDDRLQYPLGVKYSFWKKVVKILRALEEVNTPAEQVITSSSKNFEDWISKEKKDRVKNWLDQ